MDPLSLQTVADFCDGTLHGGRGDDRVKNIVTDSRAVRPGDLFLALRGERYDGHRFAAQALEKGAVGAVVDKQFPREGLPPASVLIEVDDTLRALQDAARRYRQSLSLKVVAITGSNGKTSTKDIAAALLARRFRVLKTDGNLNNHVGVPLTLLRAGALDEVAVVELGMNHAGEIAPLAAIAAPDVAIITNVGTAHIEHLGSQDAIAREKSVLAEAVGPSGQVILPAQDRYTDFIQARCAAGVIRVGVNAGDIQASELETTADGTRFNLRAGGAVAPALLPVLGEHMVVNALLAVGAALACGVSLAECVEGLADVRLTRGRLERKSVGGLDVLDDSYNANPDSMAAALRTLARLPVRGQRIAVLGRMGELGSFTREGHREVGRVAAEQGIDCLIGVGAEAGDIVQSAQAAGLARAVEARDVKEAAALVWRDARPGDLLLLKGSRSAAMEQTLEELERLAARESD